MFESVLSEFYWSSIINSVSKLPKETVFGVAAAYTVIHIHGRHCDMKVKVAEAEARKAEAEAELAKIQTFTVKD